MSGSPRSAGSPIFEPPPTPDRPPLPSSGRAGRNLPAAVGSAVVLVALVGVTLVFARWLFIGLVVAMVLIASWELAGAFAHKGLRVQLVPVYLGGAAMVITGAVLGPFWVMVSLYVTFAAILFWRLANISTGSSPIGDVMVSVFTVVYIGFNASFVALMSAQSSSLWPLVVFVACVVGNDLGGWMAGVMFGRHPMAPRLSPKKSWEGFAGSVILAIALGCLGAWLLELSLWWGPIFGLISAVFGTAGDLLESLIKRDVGLKDMSHAVPGHGGLMDRLDSVIFAAPAYYFAFALALGWWW